MRSTPDRDLLQAQLDLEQIRVEQETAERGPVVQRHWAVVGSSFRLDKAQNSTTTGWPRVFSGWCV